MYEMLAEAEGIHAACESEGPEIKYSTLFFELLQQLSKRFLEGALRSLHAYVGRVSRVLISRDTHVPQPYAWPVDLSPTQ